MVRPLGLTAAATAAVVAASTARRVPRAVVVGGFLGLLAGLSVAAARTVTRLDAARAAAELEKAASHNQLQKLIDNSSANVYMKRIDNGQYLLVNREWERLFGVTRDRVINMTDHGVFPPALADQLRANDLGVARAGKTVQYEESAESDEGMRTYVSVKFPVLDSAGEPYAICGISTDITERKRAEDEVRRLNAELEMRVRERTAELEASTRELDAFAYSVSHDLRAPLRSLHGFSEALLDDYGDVLDAEGRDNLHRLQHNVQRMGRMIDDLLNLSRATRVELTRDHIDISAMARDIVAEIAVADPNRAVAVTVVDDLHAHGDAQLVHLALQNLLANAWKFTCHSRDPCIEVGSTQHDGEQVFFVRDNGAGFDMKYANKLFNAFQRLHAVAQFEGTGIGLAIVARVVRRHGGRVFAHAEVDHGATFFFNLHTNTADAP
jgi:PAS domain S-box-containing protein